MPRKVRKLFIGLDVHKRETQICVMDENGKIVEETRIPSTREDLKRVLAPHRGARVVVEACMSWEWAYDTIQEAGLDAVLSHPRKTRMIAESKTKTDKIDAATLANLLRGDFIAKAYAAPRELRELRKKLELRWRLVQNKTQFKNGIRSALTQRNIKAPYEDIFGQKGRAWLRKMNDARIDAGLRVIEALEDEINALDNEFEKTSESIDEPRLLRTIPGVGAYTSLVLYAWIGDLDRFPTPESLANYLGMTPRIHSSGDETKRGHITRRGPSIVRHALTQAAWTHVRIAPKSHLTKGFLRLRKKRGNGRALVACARKIAVVAHAMLSRGQPFQLQGAKLGHNAGGT